MARQDIERQNKMEPERMEYAKQEIEKLGFQVCYGSDTYLRFNYQGKIIKFFAYSGWATGGSINDCRGLQKLLKQLK
ncbi:MAG: hypothetical protein ABI091_26580 [Ferruginibacter sp.]